MTGRIYSIGHSNRTAEALVALLEANGVDLVIDVRRFPRSRRHPQFNIETLPGLLAGHGIGYRHMESLGGRRSSSLGDASPSGGWREPGFRNFADYALTAPFREAVASLLDLSAEATPAVMCAEALWWQCHRGSSATTCSRRVSRSGTSLGRSRHGRRRSRPGQSCSRTAPSIIRRRSRGCCRPIAVPKRIPVMTRPQRTCRQPRPWR
jgi:uncharacterized protein (DUF488 family)